MSAQDLIRTLAAKYNLDEGKSNDWYLCHSTHCITKTGAEKIRLAEGVKHSFPVPVVTDNSIAYLATFTSEGGTEVHEVGSCRWDGKANNPSRTHAHEMALKRLKVRGILALVAPAGQIYGSDELTAEYKQHGQASVTMDAAQSAPVAAAAAPGTTAYTNGEAMTVPPEGTQGWYEGAENLPSQWNGVMAKLSEVTSDDRSKWEMKIIDHLGVFHKDDGTNWYPSSKWGNFAHMAGFLSTYDGVTKSKAKYSYRILKLTRELVDEVAGSGSSVIKVANAQGGMDEVQILRKDQKAVPQAPQSVVDAAGITAPQAPKTFTPDDIPF